MEVDANMVPMLMGNAVSNVLYGRVGDWITLLSDVALSIVDTAFNDDFCYFFVWLFLVGTRFIVVNIMGVLLKISQIKLSWDDRHWSDDI